MSFVGIDDPHGQWVLCYDYEFRLVWQMIDKDMAGQLHYFTEHMRANPDYGRHVDSDLGPILSLTEKNTIYARKLTDAEIESI